MIYTCYDMIRDCRKDAPEGWSFFIQTYVPVIRMLLAQYQPGKPIDAAQMERVLAKIRDPESSLFRSLEPAPERWFLAELRQKTVAELPVSDSEIDLDLETVAAALEPLTVREKQVAWLETMHYDSAQTGAMLRMAPDTVTKIRAKSADLIRGKVDSWRRTILAENGLALGKAALAAHGEDCSPPKVFLDILDGRTTWGDREMTARHVNSCWHCIDHYCRLVEVVELLRGLQPLSEAEAEPIRKLWNLPKKRGSWKNWFASGA